MSDDIYKHIIFDDWKFWTQRGRNGYVYETNSGTELYLSLPYNLLELKRLLSIYLQSLSLLYAVVTLSAEAQNYWILKTICYCDLQNIDMCCFCLI